MPPFLTFAPFQHPANYFFIDPDTGHRYRAATKKKLFEQILNYREQNRLPAIPALELVLENFWCSQPENIGKCKRLKLKRGWMQTLRGGIALLENLFYGEHNMVPPPVAEERAKICIKCPFNQAPDKGPFLKWSDEVAEAATGGKKVPQNDELYNCMVCSCPLKAKIWHKGPFDLSEDEEKRLPDFCWQRKDPTA